jgi:hypothetical protein
MTLHSINNLASPVASRGIERKVGFTSADIKIENTEQAVASPNTAANMKFLLGKN